MTPRRCTTLVLFALAGCASPPAPQPARVESPRELTTAGYHYLTFVTGNAKPTEALPMIIGLHYSSARPETIVGDFDLVDIPARIILPQGHYPRRDGYSWFPASYGQLGAAEQKQLTFRIKDELAGFVAAVTAQYPTTGKPIVVGTSYGGDLSYLLAIYHSDRVAAAFPVAARFPDEWIPASNTCAPRCAPVHAMHGDKDETVPIEPGRRIARGLVEAGYRVELHEYAGVAHDFSAQMKVDFARMVRQITHSPSRT